MSGKTGTRAPRPRHIRVPVPLLLSRRHSPLAVAVYGLLDLLARSARDTTEAIPAEATRRWLAGRLGASESGVAKALGQLMAAHPGDATTPAVPAYVVSTQRGHGLSALRQPLPGVPWVEIPEWTLGSAQAGPLAPHRVWRFYALLRHLKHRRHGTVAHPRAQLAALAGVRPDSLPALQRAAEEAGLLVVAARPGLNSVLLPLDSPLDAQARAATEKALLDACGKPAEPHPQAGTAPHPSAGTAPHPPAGMEPHPSTGTAYREDPPYGDPNHEVPAPERAPLAGHARPALVGAAAAERWLEVLAGAEEWVAFMAAEMTAADATATEIVEAVARAAAARAAGGVRLGAVGRRLAGLALAAEATRWAAA